MHFDFRNEHSALECAQGWVEIEAHDRFEDRVPAQPSVLFFFFKYSAAPRDLPSSPTRPSSDLRVAERPPRRGRRPRPLARPATPPDGAPTPASRSCAPRAIPRPPHPRRAPPASTPARVPRRSEEHTSELQSQSNLVCRLLLEKK